MQQRNWTILWISILGLLILSACDALLDSTAGNGNVVEETRTVSNFTEIRIATGGRVYVTLGDEYEITVNIDENLLDLLTTEVDDNTLVIDQRSNTGIRPTELTVRVTLPELEGIHITGAGDINVAPVESDSFAISISGAGDVRVDELIADELDVEVSGAGNVVIEAGRVTKQDIRLSGAGNYNAGDVESETVEVNLSGVGAATINASESITGNLSGVGSITYSGDASVDVETSGVGSIRRN
ncbi:MAG: head GIN domain-containing protein [Anaerolineae bacterium]